jgi:hypothetical protein
MTLGVERVRERECIKYLIFGPSYGAANFQTLARHPTARRALQFGHLEAGFHFVPEGHAIVARRFIAGSAINKVCVPEGRLKLVLGATNPACRIDSR